MRRITARLLGNIDDIQLQLFAGRVLGISMPFSKLEGFRKIILNLYCLLVFFYIMISYTMLETIDAVLNIRSLENTTENLCLTLTHVAGVIKIINLTIRSGEFEQIIKTIRLMTDKFCLSEDQKKTAKLMRIKSLVVFIAFFTLVFLTACLGAITLYANVSAVGSKFPYHLYVPNLLPKQLELFSFALAVGWNALIIVTHDCLFISLMNHICSQLQILQIALKNLTPKNKLEVPTDEIKKCIQHHQMIIDLRNQIQKFFSGMLMLQFLTSLGIFGMTGFQATVNEKSGGTQQVIYAYCCCILFETFVYCWFSNQVIEEGNSLSYCAYYGPWYDYGKKYNKLLILLLMKAQVTIQVTAGGFFSISLETFKTILTRTYSFVALLRQVYYK